MFLINNSDEIIKILFYINENFNKNLFNVNSNNIEHICIIEVNNHVNNKKEIHNYLLDCNKFNFNSEKILNIYVNHEVLKQEMRHIYNCYNYIFINTGFTFYLCRLYINFVRTLKIIENSLGKGIIENLLKQDSKLINEVLFQIKRNRTNNFKKIINFSEKDLNMSNYGYININLTITNINNNVVFKTPFFDQLISSKELDEKEKENLEKKLKCLFNSSFNRKNKIFLERESDIEIIIDYLKKNLQSIIKLDYENIN